MNKKIEEKSTQILPTIQGLTEIKPELLLRKLHGVEGTLAAFISTFAGSMPFVYFHVLWFGLWIIINQGYFVPHIYPFDSFPYGLLTMVVSLEAIFLATFIMITQNRQSLIETYKELEEEKEEQEAEEEVEDIQKDLDDIKNAISFIQQKITQVEKAKENVIITNGGTGGAKAV